MMDFDGMPVKLDDVSTSSQIYLFILYYFRFGFLFRSIY